MEKPILQWIQNLCARNFIKLLLLKPLNRIGMRCLVAAAVAAAAAATIRSHPP